MGSATQIGLGVIILGAAFVFGHYVQQNSLEDSAEVEMAIGDVEWQSAELRERIAASHPVAPPAQDDVPQSSMPIAGLNNTPVVRKNDATDFPLPGSISEPDELDTPPTVPRELPPLRTQPQVSQNTDSEPDTETSIIQPDFSRLMALEQSQKKSKENRASTLTDDSARRESLKPIEGSQNAIVKTPVNSEFKGDWRQKTNLEPSPPIQDARPLATLGANPRNRQPITVRPPDETNQRSVSSKLASNEQSDLRPIQQARRMHLDAENYLTYVTRTEDTLQKISTRYFGSPDYYLDIYVANRNKLKNPIQVPANIELRIPVYRE